MNLTQKAIWIAEQAFDGFFYIDLVTIVLLALALGLGIYQRKGIKLKGSPVLLLPFTGVLFIVFCGAYFEKRIEYSWLVSFGCVLTILLSVYVVWRFKGARLFAAATSSLILWYGLWCAFISAMSIADDWI